MGKNQRKWRNVLLDKNFQLSFTLLLVGLAALLMILLGFWVKDVAHNATEVQVHELWTKCADLEIAVANSSMISSAQDEIADPVGSNPLSQDASVPPVPADSSVPSSSKELDERSSSHITMGETSMELLPAPELDAAQRDAAGADEAAMSNEPPHPKQGDLKAGTSAGVPNPSLIADLKRCNATAAGEIDQLWASYRRILYILVGIGFILILGLAIYGLRMTHKVAGPLFKVGLYLEKLEAGTYDQVWNLRKGDQLTEFYEHFRAAHRELTLMQIDDIAVLEAVVEAADAADATAQTPKARAALSALRKRLAEKRNGLKISEDQHG